MKKMKEYLVQFAGLKLGKHQFDFHLDNSFFEHFEYNEFNKVDVKVNILLEKKSTMLELAFKFKGFVNVPCDLTNEFFDLPVKGKLNLIVKFGEEYNDDNEELLVLPHGEYQFDVSQYIYEGVVLSVPAKRIHPGVKDGTLKTELLDKLNEFSPKGSQQEQENIDPRWENLRKLLTDK